MQGPCFQRQTPPRQAGLKHSTAAGGCVRRRGASICLTRTSRLAAQRCLRYDASRLQWSTIKRFEYGAAAVVFVGVPDHFWTAFGHVSTNFLAFRPPRRSAACRWDVLDVFVFQILASRPRHAPAHPGTPRHALVGRSGRTEDKLAAGPSRPSPGAWRGAAGRGGARCGGAGRGVTRRTLSWLC